MYIWNPVWGKQIVDLPVPEVVDTVMKDGKKLGLSVGEEAELYLRLRNETPTLLVHRLESPMKSSEVLINSMSDPVEWEESWTEKVLERINRKSQRKKAFVFLSKKSSAIRKLKNLPANAGLLIFDVELLSLRGVPKDLVVRNPEDRIWTVRRKSASEIVESLLEKPTNLLVINKIERR